MTLHEIGWTAFFEPHAHGPRSRGLRLGRVATESREIYTLLTDSGDLLADPAGRLRHEGELPAVGDWVAYRPPEGTGRALVQEVLPRRTAFVRKAAGRGARAQVVAANVDTVLLVGGLDHDHNPRRIERYLAACWDSGAAPVVILNKADLCGDLPARIAEVEAVAPGVIVHAVSARTGENLDALTPFLAAGRTLALLGSSGVGKTTLINRFLGVNVLPTAPVREGDDRGRHTTTQRQLLLLPGGALVIDTPGMRELQPWDADEGLTRTFDEIETLARACAYADCTHREEPRCAVRAAVSEGRLAGERLESYLRLRREQAYLNRQRDVHAQIEEKRRWKTIHKSVRAMEKVKRRR